MKRIALFLATNLAVMTVFGVVMLVLESQLGLERNSTVGLIILSGLFGFGGAFLSLAMSKRMAKGSTKAQVIESPRNETEAWLVNTVRLQAERAGIGMPEVAIFPSDTPNAFATGAKRDDALVAVSTGLLQRMGRREVEAVLGHEVSHVANGDMITMTLLTGVLNTFVFFLSRVLGRVIDEAVFKSRDRGIGYFGTVIVLQIVFGLLASMIVGAFSRRREYRADAGGASLTDKESMVRALQALQGPARQGLPDQVAAFGIRPGSGGLAAKLMSTHPPIEQRIAALQASPVS